MATSEISARLSSLEADEDEDADGRNVDEILEATVEQLENQEGSDEEQLRELLNNRNLDKLPTEMYKPTRLEGPMNRAKLV